MSTSHDPSGQLEDYILAVEKKEKQMRAIKLTLLAILISGGSALAYFLGIQPYLQNTDYQKYFASELSFEKVDSLLNISAKPILIKHEGREQFDTIREIEDYIQFELDESSELIVVDNLQTEFLETAADSFMKEELDRPANIALDIAGDRKVGNKLSFKIIPLGENKLPLYEIDFGNGLKKQIKSSIRYAYPTAGNYFVYVRTTDDNSQTLYKLPLVIGNNSVTVKSARKVEMALKEESNPASTTKSQKSEATYAQVESTESKKKDASQASPTKRIIAKSDNSNLASSAVLANSSSNKVPEVVNKLPATTNNSSGTSAKSTEPRTPSKKDVFDPNAVYELPSYPGGSKLMNRFISRRLRYPRMALDNKVEGVVVVKFQVDEAGKVSKPKIVKSIGFGCDEEVIRILETMPSWIPAKKNGEPIQAVHSLAINFKIQN